MNILDNLKILQNINTLEQLKSQYDFEKLNNLRVLINQLIKETDIQFKKEIKEIKLSAETISQIWNSKTNLEKLNELVFKALSAFEREELINQTSLLTDKLSSIVRHIEKENN